MQQQARDDRVNRQGMWRPNNIQFSAFKTLTLDTNDYIVYHTDFFIFRFYAALEPTYLTASLQQEKWVVVLEK